MRTARSIAAAAALLLLAPCASAWSAVAPPPSSTPVYAGLPPGWAFDFIPHATPDYSPSGSYLNLEGDAAPGYGTGSLRLTMGPVSEDRLSVAQSLAGLTSASAWVRVDDVSVLPDSFDLWVSVDGATYAGALPRLLTWSQVDLGHLPLTPSGGGTATTLLALAAAHPTTATLTFDANNGYDAGGAAAYVDGWSWTADGVTQEYDLEGDHIYSACHLTSAATTITAGRSVRLDGLLTDADAHPLAGRTLRLWSQRYDQGGAASDGSSSTDAAGAASFVRSPLRATTYYVDHAQGAVDGRCSSQPVTIGVRTKVTARAADATVARGRKIVVSGSTTPAKPGAPVSLWRVTGSGEHRLDAGKVGAGGGYELAAKATATGRWKVFVKVAGGTGNKSGRSPVRTVTVS